MPGKPEEHPVGVGELGCRPRFLRGPSAGALLRGCSSGGVLAEPSAVTPSGADGSSPPAGVVSPLRPNSDRCKFASWLAAQSPVPRPPATQSLTVAPRYLNAYDRFPRPTTETALLEREPIL